MVKEGVTIRYDSLATYPIMEENKILGLVVETISGSEYYEGKVVIDATGAATTGAAASSAAGASANSCCFAFSYAFL